MYFQDLLSEFSNELGIPPIKLDLAGNCELLIDGMKVSLSPLENGRVVKVGAESDRAFRSVKEDLVFMESLLEENLIGQKNAPLVIGLNDEHHITFTLYVVLENLTVEIFNDMIARLVDCVESWEVRITDAATALLVAFAESNIINFA
jgi:hypothetical protein